MGSRTLGTLYAQIKAAPEAFARFLASLVAIDCAEYTNPAAAGAATLKDAAATVEAVVVLGPSDLKAPGLAALAAYPRRLLFTTAGSTEADAPATATIVGTDVDGEALTEVVTLAQTATTAASAAFFSSIESITYPAADGDGATIAIGFTSALGFPWMPKLRAGSVGHVREISDGVASTTAAAFITPANGPPYGGWTPNDIPDGSSDYAVYLEREVG